ncbi:MAG TPA: hypothetical protein GX392_04930 [Clostridiales bacterium]|nr:hypothetical protein [Clostridiales bacterium]
MDERNFNVEEHLSKLPVKRRNIDTNKWETIYADYLEVKWRMVWFRTENTERTCTIVKDKILDTERQFAYFELEVTDSKGNTEIGVGSETGSDFRDYIEKAYTKAYGRALSALGYGTQFSPELDEDERIVDSPVSKEKEKYNEDSITEPQKKAIYAIYTSLGYTEDKMRELIKERYSKSDSKLLTKYEASDLIDYLNLLKFKSESHKID